MQIPFDFPFDSAQGIGKNGQAFGAEAASEWQEGGGLALFGFSQGRL